MRRPSHPALPVAAAVMLAAGAVLTGIAVAGGHRSAPPRPPAPASTAAPDPQAAAVTVRGPSGRAVTCPRGAVPYVDIHAARFHPRLVHGTSFRKGTYRLTLTGRVVNETTAAIRITGLRPVVAGRPWPGAAVTGPSVLAADAESVLRVEGVYDSPATAQADVALRLSWEWADAGLAACGDKGLVDDD